MTEITLGGKPIHTNGDLPAVGSIAPDFKLVDKNLNDKSLADWPGKKKLISIVPSLDTRVCAESTRKFNQAARGDAVLLIISADLPFAQSRFCSSENLENVIPLSMMRSRRFAKDYGVLLEDGPFAGITARAVLVLDADNKIIHAEMVPDIAHEPDYDTALSALAQ